MNMLSNKYSGKRVKIMRQIFKYLYPFFVPIGEWEPSEEEEDLVFLHAWFISPFPVTRYYVSLEEGRFAFVPEFTLQHANRRFYELIKEQVHEPIPFIVAHLGGTFYSFGIVGSYVKVNEGLAKGFSTDHVPTPGLLGPLINRDGHPILLGAGKKHVVFKLYPFIADFATFLRRNLKGVDFVMLVNIPFHIEIIVLNPRRSADLARVFWFLFEFHLNKLFGSYKSFKNTVEGRGVKKLKDMLELIFPVSVDAVPCLECGLPVSTPYMGAFCSERCFKTLFKRVERNFKRGVIDTKGRRPYEWLTEAIGEYSRLREENKYDRATARNKIRDKYALGVRMKRGRPPKNKEA